MLYIFLIGGKMRSGLNMVKDYQSLKIGDSVRLSLVRDRKRPDRVEYLNARVLCETLIGWVVQPESAAAKITGATHGVTEKNYIGHWSRMGT